MTCYTKNSSWVLFPPLSINVRGISCSTSRCISSSPHFQTLPQNAREGPRQPLQIRLTWTHCKQEQQKKQFNYLGFHITNQQSRKIRKIIWVLLGIERTWTGIVEIWLVLGYNCADLLFLNESNCLVMTVNNSHLYWTAGFTIQHEAKFSFC